MVFDNKTKRGRKCYIDEVNVQV